MTCVVDGGVQSNASRGDCVSQCAVVPYVSDVAVPANGTRAMIEYHCGAAPLMVTRIAVSVAYSSYTIVNGVVPIVTSIVARARSGPLSISVTVPDIVLLGSRSNCTGDG